MFAKSFKDEKCHVSADYYDGDRWALSAVCRMNKNLFPIWVEEEMPSEKQEKKMYFLGGEGGT